MWEWIQNNGSALMVIITFIYVIATVFIFIANNKSAKATREQLEESKRQFSETQRLSVLPCLSVSIGKEPFQDKDGKSFPNMYFNTGRIRINDRMAYIDSSICVKNIGSGLACDLHIEWIVETETSTPSFRLPFLGQNTEEFLNANIAGESKDTVFSQNAEMKFFYSDIIGNNYEQTLELSLTMHPYDHRMTIDTYRIDAPKLVFQT